MSQINQTRKDYLGLATNFSSCLKEVVVKAILNIDSKILSYIFDDVFKSVIKLIKIDDILMDKSPGSEDW